MQVMYHVSISNNIILHSCFTGLMDKVNATEHGLLDNLDKILDKIIDSGLVVFFNFVS